MAILGLAALTFVVGVWRGDSLVAMFMAVVYITLLGVLLYGLVLALERLLVPKDARLD